jgi:hypothetical protein
MNAETPSKKEFAEKVREKRILTAERTERAEREQEKVREQGRMDAETK